ncbi:hypothetical protein [uncultured Mucilaginibacter sp.]|uniref:hypothetical protein n=1 Tax=uncultured Mucilaginibacter sp. TaxID=797541 RepID=UPI0025F12CB4|nr:hypothetical protein [uncultured Mucilaginibacter sp.]
MQSFIKKLPLLLIPGIMLLGLLINSCKKEDSGSYINTLLTNGVWRLASVRTELFHADTSKRRDTLNTNCNLLQTFTFTNDGSCSYANFHCLQQNAAGRWQLRTANTTNQSNNNNTNNNNLADSVFLNADVICKDTIKTNKGSSRPFLGVRITNLGENSLVIEHTRLDTVYRTPVVVQRRLVTRYGFIH